MINRRDMVQGLVFAGVWAVSPAHAAVGQPFVATDFEAAQKAGKSILVVVHAPWCPTCRVQEPILKKLLGEAKYSALAVFSVDFDSQKDALRSLNASKQSTLIGFKGARETKRSSGDTELMSIEDILESTI